MSDSPEPPEDWRYDELRRLGDAERRMTTELADTRDAIARLVTQLLPSHASASKIESVVRASGYSRWMVDRMREGKLWLR
ncbi:hypothetical protein [Micromonospora sp. NPDC003816]|uniref:hypothetical protein n=1 Tax=Micromonospora sp. NPDC003816 TaxID=3364224 RepID=UPI0036C51932